MLKDVIEKARGHSKCDLVLRNARVVNVYSAEIENTDVAIFNGKIIGHALFFPTGIQAESGKEYPCLSLGPIAVIPEYQKSGIGGQLIESGHHAALELNYKAVVLLGHPDYYPRFGYLPAEKWDLANPWNVAGDPWMAVELVEGALEGKAGAVIYPAAFNEAT